MSDFTWTYLDASGQPMHSAALPTSSFPTQAEAEAWFAQDWSLVADEGVDAVTLMEGDTVVYGPMSLQAMD